MSIHRRLVLTAAAVLACAAAGGGIAIAQGGSSGHRSRHAGAHTRHHKRFGHRAHSRSRAHARAHAHAHGQRVRRGESRCERRRLEGRECRGRAVRRAIHRCDFDDLSRDQRSDLSEEARERCGVPESNETVAPEVLSTTEAANFAG
jgi:hypothetical protein